MKMERRGKVSKVERPDSRERAAAAQALADGRRAAPPGSPPATLRPPTYLVLRQQRQVQQDLDGLSVGRHDHDFADAAVQRLGGCINGHG